jgi:hypothetical protein
VSGAKVRILGVAGGVWLIATAAGAAVPARALTSAGAADMVSLGRGPCAIASDYDWGWCYAKYNALSDPADCEFDDSSEEFIDGCKAYVGEQGS